MKLSADLTDTAVLQEIGRRIERARLNSGLSQAQAAAEAGIGKRTLERLEAGTRVDLVTFLRVLRALHLSANLESLLPELPQNPVALLKSKGRQRIRVRPPRRLGTQPPATDATPWTWGE